MGYPVRAYRGGQRVMKPGAGGSQRPLPVPANDNWRTPLRRTPVRPPTPANDNWPMRRALGGFKVARLARFRPDPWTVAAEVSRQLYPAPEPNFWGASSFYAPGWAATLTCSGGGMTNISSVAGFTNCNNPNAVVANDQLYVVPSHNRVWTWRYLDVYIGANSTMRKGVRYDRPVGNTQPATFWPFIQPIPVPAVNPALDPFANPIGQPAPAPQPLPWWMLPYRKPNPWYRDQSERGNEPVRPPVDTSHDPIVFGEPYPGPRPVTPTKPQPPGPGEKEAKGKWGGAGAPRLMRRARDAGYSVTEALDALDAIWQALPRKYRTKGATPQQKVADLWKNWKALNVNKAILNLISNHLLDAVIGRTNAAVMHYGNQHGLFWGRALSGK